MYAGPFIIIWCGVALIAVFVFIIYCIYYIKKHKENIKNAIKNKYNKKTKGNEFIELISDIFNNAKYNWEDWLPQTATGLIGFGVIISVGYQVFKSMRDAVIQQGAEQNITIFDTMLINNEIFTGMFGVMTLIVIVIMGFYIVRRMRVW